MNQLAHRIVWHDGRQDSYFPLIRLAEADTRRQAALAKNRSKSGSGTISRRRSRTGKESHGLRMHLTRTIHPGFKELSYAHDAALVHEFDGIAAESIAGFIVGVSRPWPKCRRRSTTFNLQDAPPRPTATIMALVMSFLPFGNAGRSKHVRLRIDTCMRSVLVCSWQRGTALRFLQLTIRSK
jgi:hypothetical protein